ncbi:hypothetical protein CSB37_02100 [bacterium DOLZORAL124_38_8]|nr:MAG: hypothetical protein CSB37_02100 [bacterium DOLZORAL124_38_8]
MKHQKKAFTLIELMISITIGAVILTSALGVYAQFVQTKMRIEIARQMQKEVNFALARLTDRARNCEITSGKSNFVNLKCENDKPYNFSINTDSNSFTMNNERLISKRFKIITDNKTSKFVITNKENTQPKVQIFLKVQSKKDPSVQQFIRTTISSRKYKF